jgi:hypothetical protein
MRLFIFLAFMFPLLANAGGVDQLHAFLRTPNRCAPDFIKP